MPSSTVIGDLSAGLTHVARAITIEEARDVAITLYGIDCVPVRLGGEKDANFRLTRDGRNFLLKIVAGEDPAVCDMHTRALLHLERADPGLPVQKILPTLEGAPDRTLPFGPGDDRFVRATSYVEGRMQRSTPQTPAQRANAGAMLARLQLALANFRHPAESHRLSWDMNHCADLVPAAAGLEDGPRLVEALRRFEAEVLARRAELPFQAAHNDLNSDNIVVDATDTDRVSGIIDFGDMARTARVFDLAVGAAYQATDAADPMRAAGEFVAGFLRLSDLTGTEREVLPLCILARMAMRVVITETRAAMFPENRDYILRNTPQARLQFDRLRRMSDADMAASIQTPTGAT